MELLIKKAQKGDIGDAIQDTILSISIWTRKRLKLQTTSTCFILNLLL